MSPRLTVNPQNEPVNEWDKLRNILVAMQENSQLAIHNSLSEIAKSVYLRHDRGRRKEPSDDGSTEAEKNPFAEEVHHRNRVQSQHHDRVERSREMGFSVELPVFHGGIRCLEHSMLYNSERELAETAYDRRRYPTEDGSTDAEENPFAEEVHRRDHRACYQIHDQKDLSCELGFEVDLPESHGRDKEVNLHGWMGNEQPYLFSQKEEDFYNNVEMYGEPIFDIYDDEPIYDNAKGCSIESILTGGIYDHRDQLVDFAQHIPKSYSEERDTVISFHHRRDHEKGGNLPARDQRENSYLRLSYYDETYKDTVIDGVSEKYACYGVYAKDDQGFSDVNQNLRALLLLSQWTLAKIDLHRSFTASQIKGLDILPSESNLAEGDLGNEDSKSCLSSYQFVFGYTSFFTSSVATPNHSRNPVTCFLRKWLSHEFASILLFTPLSFWKFWDFIFSSSKEPIAGLMPISVGVIVQKQESTEYTNPVFVFSQDSAFIRYVRHMLVREWFQPRLRPQLCIRWRVLKTVMDFSEVVILLGALTVVPDSHCHPCLEFFHCEILLVDQVTYMIKVKWNYLMGSVAPYDGGSRKLFKVKFVQVQEVDCLVFLVPLFDSAVDTLLPFALVGVMESDFSCAPWSHVLVCVVLSYLWSCRWCSFRHVHSTQCAFKCVRSCIFILRMGLSATVDLFEDRFSIQVLTELPNPHYHHSLVFLLCELPSLKRRENKLCVVWGLIVSGIVSYVGLAMDLTEMEIMIVRSFLCSVICSRCVALYPSSCMVFIFVDMGKYKSVWPLGVLKGGSSFWGIRAVCSIQLRLNYISLGTMWWSDVACALSKPFYSGSLFCVCIPTSVFSLAAWTKFRFGVWPVEEGIFPVCLDKQDRYCLCLRMIMSFFDMKFMLDAKTDKARLHHLQLLLLVRCYSCLWYREKHKFSFEWNLILSIICQSGAWIIPQSYMNCFFFLACIVTGRETHLFLWLSWAYKRIMAGQMWEDSVLYYMEQGVSKPVENHFSSVKNKLLVLPFIVVLIIGDVGEANISLHCRKLVMFHRHTSSRFSHQFHLGTYGHVLLFGVVSLVDASKVLIDMDSTLDGVLARQIKAVCSKHLDFISMSITFFNWRDIACGTSKRWYVDPVSRKMPQHNCNNVFSKSSCMLGASAEYIMNASYIKLQKMRSQSFTRLEVFKSLRCTDCRVQLRQTYTYKTQFLHWQAFVPIV